jgi:hypothetical protein
MEWYILVVFYFHRFIKRLPSLSASQTDLPDYLNQFTS